MDGGQGWPMIGCSGGAQDSSPISRIMLRYRPIAPKPANGADISGRSALDNKKLLLYKGRTKRKYVRVRRNSKRSTGYSRNNKKAIAEEQGKNGLATLQLLPETDRSDFKNRTNDVGLGAVCDVDPTVAKNILENNGLKTQTQTQMKLKLGGSDVAEVGALDLTKRFEERRAVEMCVTVECITGTCMEGQGFDERLMNLETDTCPWLLSDGLNRVVWVNNYFKRMIMVSEQKDDESPEMMVGLVIKEILLQYLCCVGFSCHVKLQYAWRNEKYSKIVPCDVWRLMDGERFAWRLDVKAALTLGRSIDS